MTIGYYYYSYFKSMPQLTISNQTYKVTKGNIEKVFKSATKERIAETRKWYSDAQKFTETLSLKFDNQLSSIKIAGVIAALSPRNEWNRNKFDAETLCKEFLSNKYYQLNLFGYHTLLNSKVCTFNTNKSKAIKILLSNDSEIENILKGNKLINFYRGIIGDTEAVCIDGHAFNIASNRVTSLAEVPAISDKNYKTLQNVYRDAKNFINKRYGLNLKTGELQAVTWNEYKRLHNK